MRVEPGGYNQQLDGLRAFAVGAVLFAHFFAQETILGHQGVRLFFVLSGFLISRILIDMRQQQDFRLRPAFRTFYMRRILRIVPAYLVLVMAVFLLGAVDELGTLKWYLTYTSNFLHALRNSWEPWVLQHTWSLSIEEQFYAVWPLIIFLTPARYLKAVCWAAIGLSLAYRCYLPITLELEVTRDLLPPASMDALAAGALLAVCRFREEKLLGGYLGLLAVLGLAVTIVVYLSEPSTPLGEWGLWFAQEVLLLPVFLYAVNAAVDGMNGWAGRILGNAPTRYVGRISYGIYLYHPLVLWCVVALFPGVEGLAENGPMRFVVCGSLTIAVASLSWYLLEEPINRLKRHFPYSAPMQRTRQMSGAG